MKKNQQFEQKNFHHYFFKRPICSAHTKIVSDCFEANDVDCILDKALISRSKTHAWSMTLIVSRIQYSVLYVRM